MRKTSLPDPRSPGILTILKVYSLSEGILEGPGSTWEFGIEEPCHEP